MSGLPQIEGVTGLSEIGRGGFGVVYRGTEVEFGRDVAVKVLMPTLDERARRRFERERRAMGAVSDHPNIVTVYRGGLTPTNQPYLVMEYLAGGSLSDRLNQVGPLDWREAAAIGGKLADALSKAHRAGILHRDLKPGNVFMTSNGEPKLGDFGIARLSDGHESRTGSITASIAHAPPEIVDGEPGDERSDLYSLASTIYALTVGAAPFSRGTDQGLAALLSRIAHEDAPPLHLESAADHFEASIAKALNKKPDDRQDTVMAFGNELRRSALAPITQPIDRNGSSSTQRLADDIAATPARQTNPGQLVMLGILALAIAGFGGWAVARAVFDSDGSGVVPISSTAIEPTTSQIEPTAVPAVPVPTSPSATAVPATQVPAVPTSVPAAPTPVPSPTSTASSQRGSNFGPPEGFTTIRDFSGAITVAVPTEWASEVHDASEIPDIGFTARVLAAGGSLQALSGDAEIRDLSVSGIYIFTARLDGPVEIGGLLDGALDFWADCTQGVRSQLLLPDGNAEFQLLQCDSTNGDATGIVALTLVPDDDPTVGVSVFMQFAGGNADADAEVVSIITETLRIDGEKIPLATVDS